MQYTVFKWSRVTCVTHPVWRRTKWSA